MTSTMEMAQPATRGICGMRRLIAIAVPITCGIVRLREATSGKVGPRQTHLCQVSGDDGDLGHGVQNIVQPTRQESTASLGEVEPGDCAQLYTEALKEDGEQVAEQHYEEQAEAIGRAGCDIG